MSAFLSGVAIAGVFAVYQLRKDVTDSHKLLADQVSTLPTCSRPDQLSSNTLSLNLLLFLDLQVLMDTTDACGAFGPHMWEVLAALAYCMQQCRTARRSHVGLRADRYRAFRLKDYCALQSQEYGKGLENRVAQLEQAVADLKK